MTLSQLIAQPANPRMLGMVCHQWQSKFDVLASGVFQNLTLPEKQNLLAHLSSAATAWDAVPAEVRDATLASLLRAAADDNYSVACLIAAGANAAGPETVEWLEQQSASPHLVYNQVPLQIIWKHKGVKALPSFAARLSSLGRAFTHLLEPVFDQFRTEAGISKPAWDLLMYASRDDTRKRVRKDAIEEFTGMLESGSTLPASEWKLLADHPVHGEIIAGLVFASGSGRFFLPPDWPENAAEPVCIAHPAMFSAPQLAEWQARAAGCNPAFDQWKLVAAAAVRLDPVGITTQPSELFLHLEANGWTRGRPAREDGIIRSHTKTFTGIGVTAEIEYDGVPTRFGGKWTPQTIRRYRFFRQHRGFEVALNDVHPIAMSSVMADLAPLQKSGE